MLDNNRKAYIADKKADFVQVQKDNKLLIHYILDRPTEICEFEDTLGSLYEGGKFDEGVYETLLTEHQKEAKHKKGRRVGVIVAARPENTDRPLMGWSLCNMKKDRFNKYVGICKALDRLQYGNPRIDEDTFFIPNSVKNELVYFSQRVEAYFHTLPAGVPEANESIEPAK